MKKASARVFANGAIASCQPSATTPLQSSPGWPGRKVALGLVVVSLVLTGCQGFEPKTPAGFAAYEDTLSGNDFRAITASGVRYRVRQVPNEPEGDASLWTEAVRRNLTKKGYHVTETKTLRTEEGREVQVVRTTANMAGKDYIYITAFCLNGKKVVIIEVAGAADDVRSRDKDIETAMRSLKIR